MQKNDVIQKIVQQAVKKGYFAIDEYPGLRLTAQQFKDLGQNLSKKGISIHSYQQDKSLNPTTPVINILLALRHIICY